MFHHLPRPSRPVELAVLVLILASLACGLPFTGAPAPSATSTPSPSVTPTPPLDIGDYGDAPDGDRGMESGYYAPTGGPFLFTYQSAGVDGNFPTMGDDPVPGPFTIDVDEFWIGPLFGSTGSGDIPSLEQDADDVNDPDGQANLLINAGGADCDKENGVHNPSANGCSSQPAFSMPMNARLMIVFGQPPLGMWITSVTASDSMSYSGPVYWNLLFDLNQDGDWDGPGEWISQDVEVNLEPGETETLISPAFNFPTSGSPWGRLNFPYWVRSMVTSHSVDETLNMADYDGRGPQGGFEVGEVEDYFVEWRPIGPRYKDKEPVEAEACGVVSEIDVEQLPSNRSARDVLELVPGNLVNEVQIFGLPGGEGPGAAVTSGLIPVGDPSSTPFAFGENEFGIEMGDDRIVIQADQIAEGGARILVVPEFGEDHPCQGNAPVGVSPGFLYSFLPIRQTVYGSYLVTSKYERGDRSHNPFAKGEEIEKVDVSEGSIVFSGNPPFVTVSGERDESDGSFSAQGSGVVAGYSNIAVAFEGTLTEEGLSGEYTMGAEGGLPGGESITYVIEGKKAPDGEGGTSQEDSGPVPVTAGEEEAIQAFIDVFNGAFEEGDADPLFRLLHPAVYERYSQDACRTYLEGNMGTPVELAYQDAVYVGEWDWELDGQSPTMQNIFRVLVDITAGGQSGQQQIHLAIPGDDSVRWFTDCGEPVE